MNNSSVVDLTATGQPQVGDCFEGATAVDVTCDMFGGSSVAAGDQVSVQLDGIINPTVASATSETLQVATTSDTTPVNSSPYTIQPAHAMAASSVTDTPPSAGSTARTIYTVVFTTSATGGLSGSAASQISVTLPSGTSAASMNNSSVVDLTATGQPQVGDCFEGATAVDVICDMFGGSSVAAGDQVSVQLDGIINPTVASATSETLQVATTSDTTPVNSGPYTIQPAHAMAASSVTLSNSQPGASGVAYTIAFATSPTGGLSGSAASQISVTLPSGTSAASMNNSSVVDLTATGHPQVGDCFEGATAVDVICDMFGGSSVAAGDQVSVQLDGIINPTTGSKSLQVATTSDTTPVPSSSYSIGGPPPSPTVTGVTPTSGPAAGGTSVTITGTNFTGATAVKFGAASATFTLVNASEITATAPPGAAGTVDIIVTTPQGSSSPRRRRPLHLPGGQPGDHRDGRVHVHRHRAGRGQRHAGDVHRAGPLGRCVRLLGLRRLG